jgi:hypothetical protein
MAKVFKINAAIDSQGIFWDAEHPSDTYPGHLRRVGRRIELTTAPTPAGPRAREELFGHYASTPAAPEVIHGTTMHGSCTLVGLTPFGGDRYLGVTGKGFASTRLRADACIIGQHLLGDKSRELASATFTYKGLEGWVTSHRQVMFGDDRISFTYPELPPMIDVCVLSGRTRIVVESRYLCKTRASGRDTARSELFVEIEPGSPESLAWFLEAAFRVENFLSACIGSSVRLRTARVTGLDGDDGWVVRPRGGKAGKPHRMVWIQCDSSQLAAAFAGWLSRSKQLEPFEDLIYGTIRGNSFFVQTEFLSLAQAIESFHRLTSDSAILPSEQFKAIRKSVLEAIDESCDGPIATRLKEAIGHANEPTLQNRIDELLLRLPRAHVTKLLGSPEEFSQTLRQTRNYLTHPGTTRGSKVVTRSGGLFLINQKLHALLRFLVLTHWGFPPEIVVEPVCYQSGRWQIL